MLDTYRQSENKMKKSPYPVISALVFLAASIASAGQANMPDCVGIQVGISAAEARQLIERYDPGLKIQAVEVPPIPGISVKPVIKALVAERRPLPLTKPANPPPADPHFVSPSDSNAPTEVLEIGITPPPSQPTVWKVFRSLRFEPGHEKAKTALLDALGAKYGKESCTETGSTKVSRYWVFGPNGNLVLGQPVEFRQTIAAQLHGLGTVWPGTQKGSTKTYVVAELETPSNPEVVSQLTVTVIDIALNQQAIEAEQAILKETREAKARQEVEKAKRQELPRL